MGNDMGNYIRDGFFNPTTPTDRLRAYLRGLHNVERVTLGDVCRDINIPPHEILAILDAAGAFPIEARTYNRQDILDALAPKP